jgi:hypothetical protein
MSNLKSISIAKAIEQMRNLTNSSIPFSIGFITCNTTNEKSKGYKVVNKCLLRKGLPSDSSDKADILIAYLDCDDKNEDKNRFFYYPLLMMFNGMKVQA